MHVRQFALLRAVLPAGLFVLALQPLPGHAQDAPAGAPASAPQTHDGSHDFDWEIGKWKTVLKRRLHPLTGSNTWVAYEGTSLVHSLWGGGSNLVELDVAGSAGRIQGGSWRLYNPQARQWSLNFSNARVGTLSTPTIGEFRNGRGEFYSGDTLDGRAILVRFVISNVTHDSAHFEQAFSDDGGRTWETNWIADDTRLRE